MTAEPDPGLHPLTRRALRELGLPEPVARDEYLHRPGIHDFISNVNPLADDPGLARYPPAVPRALQAAYARMVGDELAAAGMALPPGGLTAGHVLFTEGSVSAIDLLVRGFCEPFTDRVCVCGPTFPFYARAALANDVAVVDVPLRGPALAALDPAAIAAAAPRLTFLCSPNNPVGSLLEEPDVTRVLATVPGLVVVDEAYVDFAGRPSLARWLPRFPNLVVLRTFSKAWGLAAVRAGVALADPPVLQTLRAVQNTYGFGGPAQALVADRLAAVAQVRQQVQTIVAERERLRAGLAALPYVRRIYPSAANFLLVEVVDAAVIQAGLLRAGMVVANTSHLVPNTLRISAGAPADNDGLLAVARALA